VTPARKNLLVWVGTVLAAAVFLAAAAAKLSGQPQAVDNFHKWGFSDDFRLFVGSAELVGAIGLLIPATATLAGTGLAVIMFGAIFTHLAHGEGPMFLIPLVLLVLVLWVAKSRRTAIGSLLGASVAHG
jgi:putative oxidoreductase